MDHICKSEHSIFSKTMRLPEERVELIHKLSKESDIYERLARAIGNREISFSGR